MPPKAKKSPASRIVNTPPSPFDFSAENVRIEKLLLDPNNYRFWDSKKFKQKASNRFHEDKVQEATLDHIERNYQLDELKNSILVNGYVPMERIIVAPYQHLSGYFVVIEGNRRIAALKSILKERDEGVISLTKGQVKQYSLVPCAILQSTGKELKHAERVIMGIRHIAGPKEWGAYQQALLVHELKDEEDLDFKEIGEMLGISTVETTRRYRAIAALKYMQDDELYGNKAEPSFYRLLHEMISSPEVRDRFGWSHEQTSFDNVEKAREFFQLITSDGKHDPKLTTYLDVRRLKTIVGSTAAMDSLRDPEQPLQEAVRIADSGKTSTSPSDILLQAFRTLQTIGVSAAKSLKREDLDQVEQIIAFLNVLKQIASTPTK